MNEISTESKVIKKEDVTMLKDSGSRTEFDSGAVRDIQEGKGRCDLMPLDIVANLLEYEELSLIERFKDIKADCYLYDAIKTFCNHIGLSMNTMMLEVSKQFEAGAIKYGENNWKKGIPLHCYISSATRHFLKHMRGDTDEPHDRAFVWNLVCAIWTFNNKPELDDINADINKKQTKRKKTPNEVRAEYGLPPIYNDNNNGGIVCNNNYSHILHTF
jgi:hypothetical protein